MPDSLSDMISAWLDEDTEWYFTVGPIDYDIAVELDLTSVTAFGDAALAHVKTIVAVPSDTRTDIASVLSELSEDDFSAATEDEFIESHYLLELVFAFDGKGCQKLTISQALLGDETGVVIRANDGTKTLLFLGELTDSLNNLYTVQETALNDTTSDECASLADGDGEALGVYTRRRTAVLLYRLAKSVTGEPVDSDIGEVEYTVRYKEHTYYVNLTDSLVSYDGKCYAADSALLPALLLYTAF